MKERPILMNTFSVRAILDGRKTQTRRVIKPQPEVGEEFSVWTGRKKWGDAVVRFTEHDCEPPHSFEESIAKHCPYGVPGDRLWVRETWLTDHQFDDLKPSEVPQHLATLWYQADDAPTPPCMGKTRPSIFMCRWMSRILLEITGVRVERVQDISDDDVAAEGLPYRQSTEDFAIGRSPANGKWYWGFPTPAWNYVYSRDAQCAFEELWDSINGSGDFSWEANPWVWVVEFERVEPVD